MTDQDPSRNEPPIQSEIVLSYKNQKLFINGNDASSPTLQVASVLKREWISFTADPTIDWWMLYLCDKSTNTPLAKSESPFIAWEKKQAPGRVFFSGRGDSRDCALVRSPRHGNGKPRPGNPKYTTWDHPITVIFQPVGSPNPVEVDPIVVVHDPDGQPHPPFLPWTGESRLRRVVRWVLRIDKEPPSECQ